MVGPQLQHQGFSDMFKVTQVVCDRGNRVFYSGITLAGFHICVHTTSFGLSLEKLEVVEEEKSGLRDCWHSGSEGVTAA